jgi:ATP-dependent DNA helicase RecQ
VICATIAFGLGMDLPSIDLVVHWDAAESFQDFVQQTGRGGRNGSPCLCITFYDREAYDRVIRFARKSTDARERDYRVCNMLQVRISSVSC